MGEALQEPTAREGEQAMGLEPPEYLAEAKIAAVGQNACSAYENYRKGHAELILMALRGRVDRALGMRGEVDSATQLWHHDLITYYVQLLRALDVNPDEIEEQLARLGTGRKGNN